MNTQCANALIQAFGNEKLVFDYPMSKCSTMRVGGPADALLEAASADDISSAIKLCAEHDIPITIIGNGSNLVVRDGGIRGLVIRVGENMSGVEVRGDAIHAQAGARLTYIARIAQDACLSGLEFASGIPGNLGGGIYMNAGAYGGELKNVVSYVSAILPSGEKVVLDNAQCEFGYRTSAIMQRGLIVVDAQLNLQHGDKDEIYERTRGYNSHRREKQPLTYPSAGSFFKRPKDNFAGKLIQDADLCGCAIGGASVSQKHAGFIINTGNATAADVIALMRHIQQTVMDKFGIMLEPEPRIIGEDAT